MKKIEDIMILLLKYFAKLFPQIRKCCPGPTVHNSRLAKYQKLQIWYESCPQ